MTSDVDATLKKDIKRERVKVEVTFDGTDLLEITN